MYGITDLTTFVLGTIFIVLLPGPNSVFVLSTASMHGIGAGYRAAAGVFVGDAILMLLASTGAASVLYANPTLFMVLKYAGAAYLAWIGIGLVREALKAGFARNTSENQTKKAGKAKQTEPDNSTALSNGPGPQLSSPLDASITSPIDSGSEFDRGQLALDAAREQMESEHGEPENIESHATPKNVSAGASAAATTAATTATTAPGNPAVTRVARRLASAKLAPSTSSPFRGALFISLLNPKAIFFFISFFVQFVDPKYDYPALTFLLLGIIVEICSITYLAVLIHGGAHLANRMRRHPKLNALAGGTVGGIFIWFGLKLAQAKLG